MKKTTLVDRITIYIMIGSLAVYLIAGLFRLADQRLPDFPVRMSAFTYIIFVALCLMFSAFLSTDVPNPAARFFLITSTMLVFAWEMFQLYRMEVLVPGTDAWRWAWYLYYLPVVFVPNTLFLGAMHSWQPAGRDIDKRWYLTLVLSLVWFVIVMTNDWHHLVIVFHEGAGVPAGRMSFGPLIFPIMLTAHILYVLTLFKVHYMMRRIKNERGVIFVYAIYAVAMVYQIYYIAGERYQADTVAMFYVSDVWGLLTILGTELGIRFGGIRSNFNFMDLFEASNAPIAIEDKDGNICYRTGGDWDVEAGVRRASLKEPQWLDEDHRLGAHRISGGAVYWIDDLESVRIARQNLDERRAELEQDNMLVRAENEMIAQRAKAEEQGHLYALLAREVEPQLEIIDRLLEDPANEDEEVFRANLAKACFYKVYVKRCCNMMLLQRESKRFQVFELTSALRESLDYLRLSGVECEFTVTAEKDYPSSALILAYRSFQRQIEERFDTVCSVRVTLADGDLLPNFLLCMQNDGEKEETCRRVI